jgi:hypothetical protein
MGRCIHEWARRPPRGAQGYDLNGNDNANGNGNNRTFPSCSEPDILTLP